MRFISRCYQNIKRYDEAKMWLNKAIEEAPYLRDPYVERALLEYKLNNYKEVEYYCLKALNIIKRKDVYINEIFSWDHTIYDLLSLSYYFQNEKFLALKYIDKAIEMSPNNVRLINNKKEFEKL
jgi:tetratricopeptide (TPR) repeat protein